MKKNVLIGVLAALLVFVCAYFTVSYLTSTKSLTNTFTVGNVSISLTESKVDELGNVVPNAARVTDGNAYILAPDTTYVKDPTIKVLDDSGSCYLFVKVENGLTEIEANDGATISDQMSVNSWVQVANVDNVYFYANKQDGSLLKAVSAGTRVPIFSQLSTGPNDIRSTYNEKPITVTAYAVQTAGVSTTNPATLWNSAFGGN